MTTSISQHPVLWVALILLSVMWVGFCISPLAQARVNQAPEINSSMLGEHDCGLTAIAGRSCIYCLGRNGAVALSCDWGHQP